MSHGGTPTGVSARRQHAANATANPSLSMSQPLYFQPLGSSPSPSIGVNGRISSTVPLSPVSTTPPASGSKFSNIKHPYPSPSSLAGGPRTSFNANADLRRSPSSSGSSIGSGGNGISSPNHMGMSNMNISAGSANGVNGASSMMRLHSLGPLRTGGPLSQSPYAQRNPPAGTASAVSLDHATAAYGAPLQRRQPRNMKKGLKNKNSTFSSGGSVSGRGPSPTRSRTHTPSQSISGGGPVRALSYVPSQSSASTGSSSSYDHKEVAPAVHVLNPSTSRAQLKKQPSLPPMSDGERKGSMEKLAAANGHPNHGHAASNGNGRAHHEHSESKDLRVAITPPIVAAGANTAAAPPASSPSPSVTTSDLDVYYGMEVSDSSSSSAADDAASAAAIAAAKRDRWVPPTRDKRVSGVAAGIGSGGRKEVDPVAAAAAAATAALQAAADEAPRQQSRLNGSRATLLTTASSNESVSSGSGNGSAATNGGTATNGSTPTNRDSINVVAGNVTGRVPADMVELTLTITLNLPTPSPIQHHSQVAVFTRDGSSYTPAGVTEAIPSGQTSFASTITLRVRSKQLLRVALFDPPTSAGGQPDEAQLIGESLLVVTKLTSAPSVSLGLKKDAKSVADVQVVIAAVATSSAAAAPVAAAT